MIIGKRTATAALAAGVAASGTLVAEPEAGADPAPPPLGWNCRAHKDTSDGDPGGSSGHRGGSMSDGASSGRST
jgi:hypothetical protein